MKRKVGIFFLLTGFFVEGQNMEFTCDWFSIRPQTTFDSAALIKNKVASLRVFRAYPDSTGEYKEDWSNGIWKIELGNNTVKTAILKLDSFGHCLPVTERKFKKNKIIDVIEYRNVKYKVTHTLDPAGRILRSDSKIIWGGYTEGNFDYVVYQYKDGLLTEMDVYVDHKIYKSPRYKFKVEYKY